MELFRLRSGEGTAPYMVLSNIVPLCPFRQINPNFAFCILNFAFKNTFAGKDIFRPFPPYSVTLAPVGAGNYLLVLSS